MGNGDPFLSHSVHKSCSDRLVVVCMSHTSHTFSSLRSSPSHPTCVEDKCYLSSQSEVDSVICRGEQTRKTSNAEMIVSCSVDKTTFQWLGTPFSGWRHPLMVRDTFKWLGTPSSGWGHPLMVGVTFKWLGTPSTQQVRTQQTSDLPNSFQVLVSEKSIFLLDFGT